MNAYRLLNSNTPIPFDPSMAPTSQDVISEMTDDEIMSVPPHIMVHAMRTASQNGAQVISPRQIPSSYMMGRTANTANQPFLHVVGSEAEKDYVWPVPRGHRPIPKHHLEDRPIRKVGMPLARRRPAAAQPITRATAGISNPIHKAWLKIRANIDFQNREDIHGDPDGLALAYARLWGQDDDEFSSEKTITLAHLTSLRSHAIAADSAFARYLGPLHERRVVSVVVSPASSEAFGPNYSCDWNAMRVTSEAKFALTVCTEGHSLVRLALPQPVGNYMAADRDGRMMVYHPRVGVSWFHGASSFRVYTDGRMVPAKAPNIVSVEMRAGIERASANDLINFYDATADWVRTNSMAISVTSNTLRDSLNLFQRATTSSRSVGRTNTAALQAAVVEAITQSPLANRRMFTRAMKALKNLVDTYERGHTEAVVYFSKKMAKELSIMDNFIGIKLSQSAAQRRANIADWWFALMEQAPAELRDMHYGTSSWGTLATYFALAPPNQQWIKYQRFINHVGRDAMNDPSFPIPSDIPEDPDRCKDLIALATDAISQSKADMYSSTYNGMRRAAFMSAGYYDVSGDDDLNILFKAAGTFWSFRSRCAENVRVRFLSTETIDPPHSRVRRVHFADPLGPKKVCVTTAPYVPFKALVKGLQAIGLARGVDPSMNVVGRVSDALSVIPRITDPDDFAVLDDPDTYVALSRVDLLRYVFDIDRLARDTEAFLDYALEDAIAAANGILSALQRKISERETREQALAAERERIREATRVADEAETYTPEIQAALDSERERTRETGWAYIDQMDTGYMDQLIEDYTDEQDRAISVLDSQYSGYDSFLDAVKEYFAVGIARPVAANTIT